MRIYITGRFRDRILYRAYRAYLTAVGHRVVSSWLDEDDALPPESTGDRAIALRDCWEIRSANLLIADITEPLAPDAGAGREWEQGYAWATQPDIWLVGEPKGAFHHLAVRQFPSWDSVLTALTPESNSASGGSKG